MHIMESLPAVMLIALGCLGLGIFFGFHTGKYSVQGDCDKLGGFVVREVVYSCKAAKQ